MNARLSTGAARIVERAPARVRITRPGGTFTDLVVSGHFRDERLCTILDEELCTLPSGETLIVRLFDPDVSLLKTVRERWKRELSDNRIVFLREVLAPSGPDFVDDQLREVQQRMESGERVNLAIRSAEVARRAAPDLRRMLLASQNSDLPALHLWVFGEENQQQAIMEHLGGMVRMQDYDSEMAARGRAKQRWRFFAPRPAKATPPVEHAQRPRRTAAEAVAAWIRKVQLRREVKQ